MTKADKHVAKQSPCPKQDLVLNQSPIPIGHRPCMDLRQINQILEGPTHIVLPTQTEVKERVIYCIVSQIDLFQLNFSYLLTALSSEYLNIYSREGIYRLNCMSQGLKSACVLAIFGLDIILTAHSLQLFQALYKINPAKMGGGRN